MFTKYLYLGAALALAALLSFTHIFVYRAGRANVRAEWQNATNQANLDAFKVSELRQRNADAAARSAAARAARLAADSARARDELDGLRNTLDATERMAAQSLAASNNAVRTLGKLLNQCSESYLGVARDADAATSEVKTLRDAWPQ